MTEKYTFNESYINDNYVLIFESDQFESKELFKLRISYIIEYIKKNNLINLSNDELHDIIIKSRVWINEKVLGAKYKFIK